MKIKSIKSLLAKTCLLTTKKTSDNKYDFEIDGLRYNIVSLSDLTCKLVGSANGFAGDIVIPTNVTYQNKTIAVVEIAARLFEGCSKLTGITIPNTIAIISDKMFADCTKLRRVEIEDGATALGLGYHRPRGVFRNCPITSLYIGRNLSYSADDWGGFSPFYKKKTITDLKISNSVTEISDYSFYGCDGIINLTIPNSVTKIGAHAFEGCNGITSFTIPESVTEIGDSAFSGCAALTTLYFLSVNPPAITNSFTNNQSMTLNVFVPHKALKTYQNAEEWKDLWNLHGFGNTTD